MPPKCTTNNSLQAAGLLPARQDPSPVVSAFTSFTHHRTSVQPQSMSEFINRPHPETPTRTPTVDPEEQNPDPDNTTVMPGGGPPDDDDLWGADSDNEDEDNDNDDLLPQDRVMSPALTMDTTLPNSLSLYNIPKLADDGLNWITYKERALTVIRARGLMRYLDGRVKEPAAYKTNAAGESLMLRTWMGLLQMVQKRTVLRKGCLPQVVPPSDKKGF
ncbi:hypothetical protein EDD22DRAFT_961596 [Suillus occidentalis]|nr:hypothetical protein EDD22DRAFT_961596 [Suillus occidentalis]